MLRASGPVCTRLGHAVDMLLIVILPQAAVLVPLTASRMSGLGIPCILLGSMGHLAGLITVPGQDS